MSGNSSSSPNATKTFTPTPTPSLNSTAPTPSVTPTRGFTSPPSGNATQTGGSSGDDTWVVIRPWLGLGFLCVLALIGLYAVYRFIHKRNAPPDVHTELSEHLSDVNHPPSQFTQDWMKKMMNVHPAEREDLAGVHDIHVELDEFDLVMYGDDPEKLEELRHQKRMEIYKQQKEKKREHRKSVHHSSSHHSGSHHDHNNHRNPNLLHVHSHSMHERSPRSSSHDTDHSHHNDGHSRRRSHTFINEDQHERRHRSQTMAYNHSSSPTHLLDDELPL
eukprot:PhF_6_TR35771/c0_g1_i1/m.51979